jgi:hypothetical protein
MEVVPMNDQAALLPRLSRDEVLSSAVIVPGCFISTADIRLAPESGGLLWHTLVSAALLDLPGPGPRFVEWPDRTLAVVLCSESELPSSDELWNAYTASRDRADLLSMQVPSGVRH